MDKATFAYEKAHKKAVEEYWKNNVMHDPAVRVITPMRIAVTFVVTLLITFWLNGF